VGLKLLRGGGEQEELGGGGCQGGSLPEVARSMRGWTVGEETRWDSLLLLRS
jgi:hypothetical protein